MYYISYNLYPIAPNSRLHPLKIFANPFQYSLTPQLAIVTHSASTNCHSIGATRKNNGKFLPKIIVIAATIFIDILPFSTL